MAVMKEHLQLYEGGAGAAQDLTGSACLVLVPLHCQPGTSIACLCSGCVPL